MKQIRKRLTYANVMSSIAIFLLLGGGAAFAAKKIGSNEIKGNSITTGKIKKEAVTKAKIKKASVDASKLADGAVTTAKLANDAVTGEKANESTFGTVPDATKLAGKAATEYQSRVLWAVVNSNGTEIVSQSGGISLTGHGTGSYGIRFPVSTQNTAIQVTPAIAGFAGSIAGTTDAKAGPCPDSPDCGTVGADTTNDAVVVMFREGVLANQGFYISLVR